MPASKPIRVLLVDDHLLVREGLRTTLRRFKFLRVIGTAEDGAEALRKVELLSPDVVLMDINMPRMNGLQATAKIRQRFPKTKVLVVTVHDSRQYVSPILHSGAGGYVTKDVSPDELARGIKSIHQGEAFLSPIITRMLVDEHTRTSQRKPASGKPQLTPREAEVLRLLTQGQTNKDIAHALGLSVRSVETFRYRMMRKLGVRNAAALTKYALVHSLLP